MKREWIIDGDALFPQTPACVREAIDRAAANIRRYELRAARRRRALGWAAACAVLLAGATLVLRPWQGARHGDIVAPPVLTERDVPPGYLREPVFASKDDPCYHLVLDCPLALSGGVSLPRETAVEFEKTPCPACAGGEE